MGEVLAQVAEGNCADVGTTVTAARKASRAGGGQTRVCWTASPTHPLIRCIIQRDAAENCDRGLTGCDAATCKALVGCRAGIEESISHCSQKLPRYMLSEMEADPA
jgi:hypothetical protein